MAQSPSMQTFKATCDRLGEFLEGEGFTYRKSKRSAQREGKLFNNGIKFATSRSVNSIPGKVHLEVRALAWHEAFGAFRRANGRELGINEDYLLGIPIGNLFKEAPPYIRYNVGGEDAEAVIAQIEAVLQDEVLLAFSLIDSPEALREFLASNPFPELERNNGVADYFAYVAQLA